MFEQIVKILAEQLGIPESKITLDSNIVEDLNADSLDVVELLMTLEDTTGKVIPDEKVSEIKTVGDIVEILKTL
jgi:acyl carrier protein